MTTSEKKHKILFMNSGRGYGGPTKFLYYLLCCLDRREFDPLVSFYYYNDDRDTRKIRELGVPVFFLNNKSEPEEYVPVKLLLGNSRSAFVHRAKVASRFLIRMAITEIPLALRVRSLIRKEGIDLVVLNNDVHYHLAGTVGAKFARIPCICRKAGGIGEGKKIKSLLTPHVDLFIAISRATAEDQLRSCPGTRKLVKIYEGVDLNTYNPEAYPSGRKGDLGIPAAKKIVANISRFEKGKGQTEFLEAATLVIRGYPEVVFLMVGDGKLMETLRARVESLGISNYVLFTGWREDIPEILSAIDIFVHCPTATEGLGIANLEAMAMGKPTIVSDIGGLPDAVVDKVTGLVVPPGSTERLAGAILKLLGDEQLSAEFGKNARKRIEEKFDIRKNVRKMEDFFAVYI